MIIRIKVISRLLLTGVGCCFLLSGCESMNPGGPAEKLTIAIPKNLNPVLVKIADAKGFFREEGLDVTLQLHPFGKAALQSLLDGTADIATAADTPIMFAMMKGAKLSVLATIDTSSRNEAVIARKDRGIATVADLKGRRVGVAIGTSSDYFFDSYLILNVLSDTDVVIVDMAPDEMAGALLQGKVDAVSIWKPLLTLLQKELGNRAITFHSDRVYTGTFDVVSMQTLPQQRPETIKRLLRALVKAEEYVAVNPRDSQRTMAEFSGMDGALIAGIWNDFNFKLSLNQSLLVTLEDQGRWAIKSRMTDRRDLPNFLEALYLDGLTAVKPDAVRVIR